MGLIRAFGPNTMRRGGLKGLLASPLYAFVTGYTEVIRGTPALVQILLIQFWVTSSVQGITGISLLAGVIALSVNTLELLVTERYTVTGRLAEDVASEIAGPLNDILTGAATLMEEYIGHDDLRKRRCRDRDRPFALRQHELVAHSIVTVARRRPDSSRKEVE